MLLWGRAGGLLVDTLLVNESERRGISMMMCSWERGYCMLPEYVSVVSLIALVFVASSPNHPYFSKRIGRTPLTVLENTSMLPKSVCVVSVDVGPRSLLFGMVSLNVGVEEVKLRMAIRWEHCFCIGG